jgi:hypothetical protein
MRLALILILLVFANDAQAQQNSHFRIGARSAGMAYLQAGMKDIQSAFHNPAGLSYLRSTEFNLNYEYRFGLEELSTLSAAAAFHSKYGTAGIALSRFGADLYNTQRASLSFSNQFGLASLGIRVNIDQIRFQDFGQSSVASVDFGGMAPLTKALHFGAFIRNLSQSSFNGLQQEYVPTVLALGLVYQPLEEVMLSTEIEKDLDLPANVKVGLEYLLRNLLYLRTGYQSRPSTPHFGFGIVQEQWQLDYSIHRHLSLGYVHQASMRFQLANKSKQGE